MRPSSYRPSSALNPIYFVSSGSPNFSSFSHIAHRRSPFIDTFGARTLAEMPQEPIIYDYLHDDLRFLFRSMIFTGYHRWGFVVYRCAYGDDDLWNRYIEQLKKNVHDELVRARRAELLEKYLDWIIIEDRDTLDNASKTAVRKHFNGWVKEKVAEAGLQPISLQMITLFRYCLYIDQKCLDTLEAFQKSEGEPFAQDPIMIHWRPPMVLVLVDRLWTRSLKGVPKKQWGHPRIEGSSKYYVGWLYKRALSMVATYSELSGNWDLDQPYDNVDYARPPAISPIGDESMPE
ncbi:hypothetical protein CDEST_09641 [Colletotrichum destructivum]|uniref:Uncharacterized protein n=1 Tax=Colletotrichum destructivum TaxID=34406 RepID=A0AAX4IMM9_9PEZI|nr:hypothetical protein CDEST_09641 [Colletotrichum destructivum]